MPPHKPTGSPATSAVELRTIGSPSPKMTVNGVATSSAQVSTCVMPRNDDNPIGMRNAAISATNAIRYFRSAGTILPCPQVSRAKSDHRLGLNSSIVAQKPVEYDQYRSRVLAAGLGVLLLVAVIMYVRRVDPVEVVATLLFLPVFVAFVAWGIRGGIIAGAAAALAYAALRIPAIQAVGADRFAGLLIARALGYIGFGAIGGWAGRQLRASVTKLELYDHVDDETALHNSRAAVETIVRERSRADRYREIFSVVNCRFDLNGTANKERAKLLQTLGEAVEQRKRNVDSAMHAKSGSTDIVVVVLPETGAEGAAIFARKLHGTVETILGSNVFLSSAVVTYPEQPEKIEQLVDELRHIVAHDFPQPAASN